jgi:hypothetical protein
MMTSHDHLVFTQGFVFAFAIAANVQRQALADLGGRLDELERSVDQVEQRRLRRRRFLGRLERAGFRNGRELYWIAR